MELSYEDVDGVRTIALRGRMDLEGAGEVDLKFTSLAATERGSIVVDMTLVEFMASMGLGLLVRSARAVRLRSGNLVLFNPTPMVRQVIIATRIDQVLQVFSDVEEARRAARSAPPALPTA